MNPALLPSTFSGLEIRVSPHLAGCKTALQLGDEPKIYVSPAMHDLISHADEAELKMLLENIKILHLPKFDPFEAMKDYRFFAPGTVRLEKPDIDGTVHGRPISNAALKRRGTKL